MKQIRLFIPVGPVQRGDPQPVTMWVNKKPQTRLFQPNEYTNYKKLLAQIAYAQIVSHGLKDIMPLACPLLVGFRFYMPRTEIIGREVKHKIIINPGRQIFHAEKHHAQRPDLSNLVKAAEDSLTGILWKDDSLIVGHDPAPYKLWAEGGQVPGTEVIVSPCGAPEFEAKQAELAMEEIKP
jgi:Holliday junction resolvase RusA-like endonuclease